MDWIIPNLRMGESWREGRNLLVRSLRPSAIISYRQVMQEKTRWFLAELLANPNELHHHIKLFYLIFLISVRLLTAEQSSRENYHVTHIWLRPK